MLPSPSFADTSILSDAHAMAPLPSIQQLILPSDSTHEMSPVGIARYNLQHKNVIDFIQNNSADAAFYTGGFSAGNQGEDHASGSLALGRVVRKTDSCLTLI